PCRCRPPRWLPSGAAPPSPPSPAPSSWGSRWAWRSRACWWKPPARPGCSPPAGWESESAPGTSTGSAASCWRAPRRRGRSRVRRRGGNELAPLAVDAAFLDAALGHRALAAHARDAVLPGLPGQRITAAQCVAPVLCILAFELAAAGRLPRRRGLAQAVLSVLVRDAAEAQGTIGLVALRAARRVGAGSLRARLAGCKQPEDRAGNDGAKAATTRPCRPRVGSIEHCSSSCVRISH